jgi:galactokinase
MNRDAVRDLFRQKFGRPAAVVSSAPGRVNIIGEHTDYNGGQVLPVAIERRTWVALSKAPPGERSRIVSTGQAEAGEFDAQAPRAAGKWWDYVAGVCAAFSRQGFSIPQFQATVMSDVPAGAGLSSSAALEVAAAFSLDRFIGSSKEPHELAMLAWEAETAFVGVACGVMDQYASALCQPSRALHLYCDTLEARTVPLKETIMIFDTAVPRSLRASEFNTRRAECDEALRLLRRVNPTLPNLSAASAEDMSRAKLPPVLLQRAMHVTSETARVARVAGALQAGEPIAGDTLYESHESLRDQYECSSPQLDWFVERVRSVPGVRGARLTGAGWGGCAIAVGERSSLEDSTDELRREYAIVFGWAPRIWLSGAAAGASADSSP